MLGNLHVRFGVGAGVKFRGLHHNGSWCWTTPAAFDVGLIGASHASQGGRMTNATCRPKGSGVSSYAGAGSTKRCFGVQSDAKERLRSNPTKNRSQSTQQRESSSDHWARPVDTQPPLELDRGARPSRLCHRIGAQKAGRRAGATATEERRTGTF